MIKLILSDLDGTLLHDDKTISRNTEEAFSLARKHGILVGFCTSRSGLNVRDYLEQVPTDFLVANGGASVMVGNECIYDCGFSLEETRKLFSSIYEICGDDIEMTADMKDALYWNRRKFEQNYVYARDSVYDDFRNFTKPAMKICVHTWDDQKAMQIASVLGSDSIDFIKFSDIPWYKFSKKDATKEKAIKALSDYLNIPTDQMVSFGDDFNDIGMLKMCGKGIAMQNAIEEVKRCADEIALSNNEDGVADWIYRYIDGHSSEQL
ncbi:MAG: Cof-type HAD-IIB family hydrolase [Treponema sp.]|nr:Cof-type HAD-IIB family hydrolase [Treponema sp.]